MVVDEMMLICYPSPFILCNARSDLRSSNRWSQRPSFSLFKTGKSCPFIIHKSEYGLWFLFEQQLKKTLLPCC